jgi:hypothetical protein
MFGLPDKYIVDREIEPKLLIPKSVLKAEKERLQNSIKSAKISHQIIGEEISSVFNDKYACSCIMYFEVQLKSVQDSVNIASAMQKMIKEHCIIRFYDHFKESYSFAHKRLNQNDKNKISVIDFFITKPFSISFPEKTAELLFDHLDFGKLISKTNKLNLYLETMIKAYIICHSKLSIGIITLLDSKVWYNIDDMLALFTDVKILTELKDSIQKEILPGKKAEINIEINKQIQRIIKGDH